MKYMVLAMGRTGHHAIIQWILENLSGKVTIANNCTNGWEHHKHLPRKTIIVNSPGEGEHTISNIEDFYLPLWKKYNMDDWENYDHIITVKRSPKNWLASSIAAGGWANNYLDQKPPTKEKELFVDRITAYIKYLQNYKFTKQKVVLINYDYWCDFEKYRIGKGDQIGLQNAKNIPAHCKFSSFGKNRDYTGDRYNLLSEEQKNRYDKQSQRIVEKGLWW